MRQQEAAWYDSDSIKSSRDRVDRLGYFNDVNVHTTPVAGSPDQIDVNVDVKEKPTGLINLGVGYGRSEEHTSELQSLMRISYAVFCLQHKKETKKHIIIANSIK